MKRILFIVLLTLTARYALAQTAFPYPAIPATLTNTNERAAYLAEHYWDRYDFADTIIIYNKDVAELGFVNFIDLLPRLDSVTAVKGADAFALKAYGATASGKVAERFEALTEHYLDDPNSPMRNETLYILLLEAQVKTLTARGADATRPEARLTTAKKNRPGTMATDISFTTREGKRSTLYKTAAPQLLLLFYDPACQHCNEILSMLRSDEAFCQQVAAGKLKVLAVYTEGDRKLWKQTNNELPADWTVAIDRSDIVARHLYDLPAMPVFYLLDSQKMVIMKDPSINTLLEVLKP